MGTCNSNKTAALASKCCVGNEQCVLECVGSTGCSCNGATSDPEPDPCYGTAKKLAAEVTCTTNPKPTGPTLNMMVTIPAGSDSQLVVPLLGTNAKSVLITEGGDTVFKGGVFVSGVAGVTDAYVDGDTVVVHHGSGSYAFVRTG
jgi:hypothetical protein